MAIRPQKHPGLKKPPKDKRQENLRRLEKIRATINAMMRRFGKIGEERPDKMVETLGKLFTEHDHLINDIWPASGTPATFRHKYYLFG